MSLSPGWRRQVRRQHKRPEFVLRAADAPGIVVECNAKMLLVAKQAVRCMTFEVIPYLLDRIEFWRIAWKPFNMKSRVLLEQASDEWSLVNTAIVPQQDDRAAQVPQKQAEERGDIFRTEVPRLEAKIQSHPFANGRHAEGRQSGNAVVFVVVPHNWRLPLWPPGSPPTGNEKKAAFIKTNQVGPKSSRLFLYVATGSVSNERWPLRPAGRLDARAPDKTNLRGAEVARGDWDDR